MNYRRKGNWRKLEKEGSYMAAVIGLKEELEYNYKRAKKQFISKEDLDIMGKQYYSVAYKAGISIPKESTQKRILEEMKNVQKCFKRIMNNVK